MNADRFDVVVKDLAGRRSRRRVLAGLIGIAGGAAGLAAASDGANAARRGSRDRGSDRHPRARRWAIRARLRKNCCSLCCISGGDGPAQCVERGSCSKGALRLQQRTGRRPRFRWRCRAASVPEVLVRRPEMGLWTSETTCYAAKTSTEKNSRSRFLPFGAFAGNGELPDGEMTTLFTCSWCLGIVPRTMFICGNSSRSSEVRT